MRTGKYGMVMVLMAILVSMGTGCDKKTTIEQQAAQQKAMESYSQFASDNNMDLTLLISHNGKVGFYQTAAVGVDTGGQMQAVFTAKGGKQNTMTPIKKVADPFAATPDN